MRVRRSTVVILAGIAAAWTGLGAAADTDAAQAALDHAEIQNLIARYVRALDTRDADLYASVFTEDAVFDVAGSVRHGRDEIRAIVTGLVASERERGADAQAASLYHVVLNSEIELDGDAAAHHRAYWQTIRVAPDGRIAIGAMGIYDDALVKRDGEWLIATRILANFAQ